MHTVRIGHDLAKAKVCVWLDAPLDKTGHPFIFACKDTHICTRMYTESDKMASTLHWLSSILPHYGAGEAEITVYKYFKWNNQSESAIIRSVLK